MKSRMKWSIPIALVVVLLFAGMLGASRYVLAQTSPSVPSSMSIVAPAAKDAVVVTYEVSNYAPVTLGTPGPGEITTEVTATLDREVDADGTVLTDDKQTGKFTAKFTAGKEDESGASKLDRIDVKSDNNIIQGHTYTVKITAVFDSDMSRDAPLDPANDKAWDGNGKVDDDEDGSLVTTLTVQVPIVQKELTFNVEPAKVVKGEVISQIGRDRATEPLSFDLKNVSSAVSVKVSPGENVTAVQFEMVAGNKVVVNAGQNNLNGGKLYEGNITIDRGNWDLDGVDTNNTFEIKITVKTAKVEHLEFKRSDATVIKDTEPNFGGIHYSVVIAETTPPGTGVLAYFMGGVEKANEDASIPAEKVTGVVGGDSATLFQVDNDNMAIEYSGPVGGLAAGDEHILRLTASGDTGLANRLIVGKVKITVADVDNPPTAPKTATATILENNTGPGLVKIKDGDKGVLVKDFAGVASDPEGRSLKFSTKTVGFDFDGTKLLVITDVKDIDGGDNPATTTVKETDWPEKAPLNWSFAVDPLTMYPNLTRKVNVTVSDGVPSNDQTIELTVTLDVNDPVTAPTDYMTPPNPASIAATANNKVLLDVSSLVDDGVGDNDTLTYELKNLESGAPLLLRANGELVLTHVPRDVEDARLGNWKFEVSVDDGYNRSMNDENKNADGTSKIPVAYMDDATISFDVTVTITPKPDEETPSISVNVDEETTGEVLGALSGLSATYPNNADLGRLVTVVSGVQAPDKVTYNHTGGTNNGRPASGDATPDFSVNEETGAVTLNTMQNFETDGALHTVHVRVERDSDRATLGLIVLAVNIVDVNEAPTFNDAPETINVPENAQPGATVGMMPITASDVDAGDSVSYSILPMDVPFSIDSAGQISVSGELKIAASPYLVTLVATDSGGMLALLDLEITIGDVNDPPKFVDPKKTASIPEDAAVGMVVATYNAKDVDGSDTIQGVHYVLRDADDLKNFEIITSTTTAGEIVGELKVKDGRNLDVDAAGAATEYSVEVNVCDADTACNELIIRISVTDVNDSSPVFNSAARDTQSVVENTARGTDLGDYSATDADASAAFNTVSYDLSGLSAKSFYIDAGGTLRTLEALDADSSTPCGATGCSVEVIASDGENSVSMDVVITVSNAEDSVSTFDLSKANPVPGVTMGNAATALGDAKEEMFEGSAVPESPADLPATDGDAPMNFVDTQWANWGSVLRIAVTSQSPDATCGNGNQCVKIIVASDSADETIVLEAYRSAEKDNLFIAAVMPVSGEVVNGDYSMESSVDAYNRMNPGATSVPSMYRHDGAGVARLEVDEEDEITIEFGNLRGTIDVENENPEFSNFAPEHESAFDDGDVDYTFTITDPVSGIPDPEDLPDTDGDGDYMPVVAIISGSQCHSEPSAKYSVQMYAGNSIWCASAPEIREIVDDRDFDEIDDGFEVETKIVLPENRARYVTFIACDAAGNCAMYTPDENETEEALAKITIDTEEPELVEARTGIKWDATDSEYDDDRSFIQVLFEDLTALNPDTIETDDFVVEGHTIKDVHWYDVSDGDDDTAWGDDDKGTTPSRFAMGGQNNKRNHPLRQSIRNAVFIELEDELAADETPDVTVVPNGIEDSAGNEQDDGDKEADDWIAPSFTVVSIVSPGTPEGSSNVLAGDGDEVVVTLTADERIQQTRPKIDVTYVNAPAGCVNTGNRTDNNPYDRGEIKTGGDCGGSATGGTLGTTIEKVSNTEWVITIDEPGDTGYYNFYVYANDRSAQANKGSEGIAPTSIVGDFFERDGDVNSGDAHYFQGDINLGNPGVRVSGVQIEDTEPTVEFKTPLFVELDFTRPYTAMCDADDDDDRDANCLAESDEYAKDSFDSVTVTSFVLNGVDMTDSVKTTDNETFLVSIDGIGIGDHEIEVQAMDQAGNTLDKSLSIEFEVEERDPFSRRLNPGWNLVSLPGEPADSDISVVFGSNVEVRTVYTYDPIIPGGWMVAVRETLDSDWQGDLMDITARRGYWVLSDAIQDWEVSIPRLAGGAVGSGTPIQPPVIGLYAGWNLIPVVDVRGGALDDGKSISATAYLNSLDDGLDLARVLGFNTITNTWTTVLDPDDTSADAGELRIGSGYWVFVREAASLVPGGIAQ